MSVEIKAEAAGADHMERRVIRVDNLLDQVGIAAALRSAFTERPIAACRDDEDPFEALLKQLH